MIKNILSLIKVKKIKMIKKILIVLSLFFLNNVAIADQKVPNWIFVATNVSLDSFYIDLNNINIKSKNIREYWSKVNYEKPLVWKETNYYSSISLHELNCENNMSNLVYGKTYTRKELQGNSVNIQAAEAWEIVKPDSTEVAIANKICKY